MNKNILYRLSNLFGTRVHDLLIDSYLLLKDFDGREHKCRLGNKNPDKTIYCIRRRYKGSGEGLLSRFICIMGRIDCADRNGYIPFINVDEEQNRRPCSTATSGLNMGCRELRFMRARM